MTDYTVLNDKTILVTGGAGYIGSHTIISLFENSNCKVISVDNYYNSTAETYERIEKITGKKVKYFEFDLADAAACETFFNENRVDAVIHFAAYKTVPESVEKPDLYYKNNINSLSNILNALQKHKIDYLIFSSSCSVYGNSKIQPVSEETPLNKAESPYGHTKQVGEEMIQFFAQLNKQKRYSLLRYFNPVGAHPSGKIGEIQTYLNNLVPIINKVAIGDIDELKVYGDDYPTKDGTCIRDYVHVSDISMAHVQALVRQFSAEQKDPVELFNLGSGEGISVLELIQAFKDATGLPLHYEFAPRRAGDVDIIYSNKEKAENVLGWKPKFTLQEMMKTAWEWEKNLKKEKSK